MQRAMGISIRDIPLLEEMGLETSVKEAENIGM